jgi:urea transport system permease protein
MSSIALPQAPIPRQPIAFRLYSKLGWTGIALMWGVLALLAMGYYLVPAGSVFHIPDYVIVLIGKIMCYAMVALALDLVWGYAGILSLGHGLFFALGGYAFGMYLMRQIGRDGVYKSRLYGVPRLERISVVLGGH